MSGVWKRSHGRASEAPPNERGGNRYVRPTAAAPHLDSTEPTRSRARARRSGVGAPRPWRRIPAIVSFLNPKPALSLGVGNRASCPIAVIALEPVAASPVGSEAGITSSNAPVGVNRHAKRTPDRHAKRTPPRRWVRLVPVANRRAPRASRNFRAGIEAGISCLKRAYGLARCTWRGLDHFKTYIWSAVVAHNLVLVARLKPA
jgi:hypothetical protein